jgi:hypothetical protein
MTGMLLGLLPGLEDHYDRYILHLVLFLLELFTYKLIPNIRRALKK